MPQLIVSLEDHEAAFIVKSLDDVPLRGPDTKRVAANIQVKIANAAQAANAPEDVVDSSHESESTPQPEE